MLNAGGSLQRWLTEHPVGPVYIVLVSYALYNFFWPLPSHQGRALFLLFVFVGLFLRPRTAVTSKYLRWLDYALAAIAVVVFGYIVLNHYKISYRCGMPTTTDIIMGLVCILLVIEGTRRGMGKALAIVVILFFIYLCLGQHLPTAFGGHVGYTVGEIAGALYLETVLDGIFGISTYVFFRYVLLFFLFGNLLMMTGATTYLIDLVRAVVGTRRGGAAMLAVTASGAVGSISGLAMANVMITGPVTIPLMKRTGFKSEVAAGVEAAASSGGQIMPPVMGNVSFLMMVFLAVPYIYIIKAAVIPALLFYIAILASVYFFSIRIHAKAVPRSEVPKLGEILKKRESITLIGSFAVLLTLIVLRYSPMYAAIAAIATAFVLSFATPSRMNFRKTVDLLHNTGRDFVGLGAAGAGLGIVIGSTLQSGLALRITTLLLNLTGGHLIPTLIAAFIACFILGMGLPPIIIYIVSVLLVAPAVIQLGVSPMAAHLFCFYAAICAELSPPIATSAYVASLLAKSNFWKTCLFSMLFGAAAHILPFAFVLDDSLLLMGSPASTILAIGTAGVGVILMAWGIAGPFRGHIEIASRILILAAGVLLIFNGHQNVIIGIILALLGGALAFLERRTAKKQLKEIT